MKEKSKKAPAKTVDPKPKAKPKVESKKAPHRNDARVVKPPVKRETVSVKAASVEEKENNGLTIDFERKHITFGANLVPTKIKAQDPRFVPTYKTVDAACADLVANINKDSEGAKFDQVAGKWIVQIPSRTIVKIDTGFAMQLPAGWQAEVSGRSGWGERGLVVTNAPGQIDGDYRGPLSVLLANVGKEIIVVKDGDRIGQIKPVPVFRFSWETVDKLDETVRATGGFGSTGGM
jgi:dUTP pyrophosphatase